MTLHNQLDSDIAPIKGFESSKNEHARVVSTSGPHGVHDTMRAGLRSIAFDLAPTHPLQSTLRTNDEDAILRRTASAQHVRSGLGLHSAFPYEMERRSVCSGGRIFTSENFIMQSGLGLSMVAGTEDGIDLEHYLVVPKQSPNVHGEHRLAM